MYGHCVRPPTGSAPIAPTPFLERPRKGGKKSPLAVGAVAPAGSTIELRDGIGDDPKYVPVVELGCSVAASTAAAITGVMDGGSLLPG